MTLPNTNISIMDVRNAIGCPSTDLGTLCAKAYDGGKDGYAFNIVENGGGKWDGSLITDSKGFPAAYPYWNIWSSKSPAYWALPDSINKPCYLRLKHDSSNNYYYSLGAFAGHNTDARPPMQSDIDVTFRQNQTVLNQNIRVKVDMGDYDWTGLVSGVNAVRIIVYEDTNMTKILASSKAAIDGYAIIILNGINTSGAYSRTYPMTMTLGHATAIGTDREDFNDLCILPVIGSFTINVVAATTMVVNASITARNGVANVRGTASTTGFGKNLISNKAKNTTAIRNLSGYYLKEVRIVCVNSSGTEVYNKVRSPHYSDSHADPTGFKETIGEVTLSAYIPSDAWNTITNDGCRLTATLIYDKL